MLAIVSLFVVVTASLLVTRIATQMLVHTGMSKQAARFQARSAFSGAGFTTAESEAVMTHPLRRRIIRTLILLGNAGIITVLASLLLSFSTADNSGDVVIRLLVILAAMIVLYRVTRSQVVDRAIGRMIERALERFTDIETRSYDDLLRLSDDWTVAELVVEEGDWFCDRTLEELALPDEGVLALGIERTDGRWVGAPKSTARLHPGDVLTVYGPRETIARVDARDRTPDGELDWVASQVAFTEAYLEQQRQEKEADETSPDDEPGTS
jgi:K+/H+ antiporter YhaU regulatory subunit KhtT